MVEKVMSLNGNNDIIFIEAHNLLDHNLATLCNLYHGTILTRATGDVCVMAGCAMAGGRHAGQGVGLKTVDLIT